MSSNDFIYKRKSSVSFSPQKLSSKMIKEIIDASMWAPSSRNAQPWRIIGVQNGTENFNKIISGLSAGNQIWAKNSGLILIFATNIYIYMLTLVCGHCFISYKRSHGDYTGNRTPVSGVRGLK